MASVSGPLQLCLLCALLSVVLAPHKQIKLISENFCHNLTWETGNQSTTPARYRVTFLDRSKESTWNYIKECFDTNHLSCDLTKKMTDCMGVYLFSVQAFTENGTSLWNESDSLLYPIMHTVLGPPIVNVTGCDSCLHITIHPPVCHFGSPDKQTSYSVVHKVYPELTYNVALIKAGNVNQTAEIFTYDTNKENFTTTIPSLLPRTNYCVSVNATATTNMNSHNKPSPWKCAVTGPISKSDHYIPAAISGVLLTFGILLVLAALYRGGFVCLKRTRMPESLSDFPASEYTFNSFQDQLTPEPLTSVKVEFKGVKKRAQEHSEGDDTNSEDDEGYPKYTHYFGRRVMSSHDHSSANTGISGDSLLGEMSDQEDASLTADSVNSEMCQTILNENESVSSVCFAPIQTETFPAKPLESCSSFNVNLNSVLLGDSEEPWKECGTSQIPMLQDLETSCIAQADGVLESSLLCDTTDLKMGAWPVFSETCPLNETALSSESEGSDSDMSQAFGYMRRK